MNYDEIVEHYGSPDKAADAIGLKGGRQSLYVWKRNGKVPIEHQIAYEVDSAGKLKADLPTQVRTAV